MKRATQRDLMRDLYTQPSSMSTTRLTKDVLDPRAPVRLEERRYEGPAAAGDLGSGEVSAASRGSRRPGAADVEVIADDPLEERHLPTGRCAARSSAASGMSSRPR